MRAYSKTIKDAESKISYDNSLTRDINIYLNKIKREINDDMKENLFSQYLFFIKENKELTDFEDIKLFFLVYLWGNGYFKTNRV